VTYGLHSEHYQKYDVLWSGDDGRCFFLQNERPYDTPATDDVAGAWRDTSLDDAKYDYIGPDGERQQGYAAFRIGDDVKNFEGWGLVSYDVFVQNMSVPFRRIWSAFVTPEYGNIKIHQAGTLSISVGRGEIAHIINGLGDATPPSRWVTTLLPGNEFATTMPEELRDTFAADNVVLNEDGTLSMSILNATEEEQEASIIVAGYKADGRLVSTTQNLLVIKPSVYYEDGIGGDSEMIGGASHLSNESFKVELELPVGDAIASYRVFIWNGATYVPMTAVIDITAAA
jgi:hypothetical protein